MNCMHVIRLHAFSIYHKYVECKGFEIFETTSSAGNIHEIEKATSVRELWYVFEQWAWTMSIIDDYPILRVT